MFGTISKSASLRSCDAQMGSQIAAEYAAGQSAASDVYIGADSYLAPLVKHKLFHEIDWPDCCRDGSPARWLRRTHELESLYRIAGIPYNTRRTPNGEAPKSLKDMLKPHGKGKSLPHLM